VKILLVDDNEELRGTTREMLEGLGHRVREAGSGEEAVARASEAPGFDLLVTDFAMPGMDGLELADRLLRDGFPRKVVVISSHLEEPRIQRRVASGVVGFVAKPFGPVELAAAIDAVTGDATGDRVEPGAPAAGGGAPAQRTRSQGRWPAPGPLLGVAAAVLLALTVGLSVSFLDPGPPTLPEPPATSPSRGVQIQVLGPAGLLTEIPSAFRWRPEPEAVSYRITLEGVDDTVLWSSEIGGADGGEAVIELPAEAADQLRPAAAYYWRVDALDADGAILAGSPRTRFRTLPPAEGAVVERSGTSSPDAEGDAPAVNPAS